MGTDAHIASKSKQFNAKLNGKTIRVTPLTYLCKAIDLDTLFMSPEMERRANLLSGCVSRCEDAWGDARPDYVILTMRDGKPREGSTVHQYKGKCLYFDSEPIGEPVGVLQKTGRSWSILSVAAINRYAEKLLQFLADGTVHTRDSAAGSLRFSFAVSPEIAEAVIVHAWLKGFLKESFDSEHRTRYIQITSKGQDALHSEDIDTYWSAVKP